MATGLRPARVVAWLCSSVLLLHGAGATPSFAPTLSFAPTPRGTRPSPEPTPKSAIPTIYPQPLPTPFTWKPTLQPSPKPSFEPTRGLSEFSCQTGGSCNEDKGVQSTKTGSAGGNILIEVIEATNLPDLDGYGSAAQYSDPYVKVR